MIRLAVCATCQIVQLCGMRSPKVWSENHLYLCIAAHCSVYYMYHIQLAIYSSQVEYYNKYYYIDSDLYVVLVILVCG